MNYEHISNKHVIDKYILVHLYIDLKNSVKHKKYLNRRKKKYLNMNRFIILYFFLNLLIYFQYI